MRINLRYQLVLFSDYSAVRDDSNTLEFFLGTLQDYGFAIRPLVEATVGPAGVTSQARPSFTSQHGPFLFLSTRTKLPLIMCIQI